MRVDLHQRMQAHLGSALGFPAAVVEHTIVLARKQLGKQLAELETALVHGDAEAARTAAHTLKGDLGNLGLHDESIVAQSLEALLKDQRHPDAHPLCARLRDMLEPLLDEA